MAETAGERKVVGAVWTLAAILGIVSAFLIQPVAEWGGFGIVLAVLLALLGATGLWMLAGSHRIITTYPDLSPGGLGQLDSQ